MEIAGPTNYGRPTQQSWLIGPWNLGKIGGAVEYTKNNRTYRQGESGVANVGTLLMNTNASYVWTSVTAQSTNGKWRKASHAEMRSEAGDGIVRGEKRKFKHIFFSPRPDARHPPSSPWV